MSRHAFIPSRITLVLLTFFVGLGSPAAAAAQARVSEAYGKLPLHFEANRGQTHDDVRFLSRGPGYGLYLTAGETVLVLGRPNPDAVVRMSLAGAAPKPRITGLEELPGKANYFIGNDPAKWQTNVPTYAKVQYRDVYPGIDLVYYGNQRQLEYDFVVAPGADPQRIVLDFKGVERLEIDAQGELVMHAAGGALRQHKPVIYQDIDGIRREIAGRYVMKSAHQVGFEVAAYDKTQQLVIDPVLSYSTYLGGSGLEEGWSIAVDTTGSAYVAGNTESANFPTSAGALDTTLGGSSDIFVTKLNATGTALVYSTYLGGSATEGGAIGIAVDSAGDAYVTGGTFSADFPTTPGAFQTTLPGGGDAFVTKLNAAGSALVYSTYLGGTGHEGGVFRIAVDTLGNAYVVGHTDSTDFPTTPGAFQTSFAGVGAAYVTKLNAAGSALVYSTYLGESSILIGGVFKELISIAVDAAGNAYVAGGTTSNTFPTTALAFQPLFGGGLRDAFVTKLDVTGSALVYSTYLGGSVDDQAWGVAVDTAGNAYVTGFTGSNDFPVSAAAFDTVLDGNIDAFVTKLNAAGSALVYSTYLGGSLDEGGAGIAVNSLGEAYVTGSTSSMNFPVTAGAPQTAFGGGLADTFITKLNAGGSALVYSTYLGGTSNDDGLGIALDTAGNAYAVGTTSSINFPTTPGAFQTSLGGVSDAFVVKLAEAVVPPPPPPSVGKVTGGGSIDVTRGIGTFGFNVQHRAADAPIDGNLQYVNHASGAKVHSVMFTTFVITGNAATFGGTCTKNGVPCTFTVNVTDDGEPGRNDSFNITVDAGPTEGAGENLRSGNIQIH
jgi:hypothetical protein